MSERLNTKAFREWYPVAFPGIGGPGACAYLHEDPNCAVQALCNEVDALRALVDQAQWGGQNDDCGLTCPWCGAFPGVEIVAHTTSCPAAKVMGWPR